LAAALPQTMLAADDPVGILTAIYARVAKGKGDSGGTFVFQKVARTKYLSNRLAALWAKADARTPKGDSGPVDFDPVTNSQDPNVRVTVEKQEAGKATLAITIESHQRDVPKPRRQDHPLRLCPGSRSMEDRRHQGCRRRQPVVGSRPASRFAQVNDRARRLRFGPADPFVRTTVDAWRDPARSTANLARAEVRRAGQRWRRA
jgi:hypothetical protein